MAASGALLVVVVGSAGWWVSRPGGQPASASNIVTTSAAVRRMDVVARQTFAGTIGFAGTYPIVRAGAGASSGQNPAQTRAALSNAQLAMSADRTAAADTAAIGAAGEAQAGAAVSTARAAVAADQSQLTTDQANPANQQKVPADEATLQHDHAALSAAQASLQLTAARDLQANHQAQDRVSADTVALATAQTAANSGPGIITRLPAVGDEVARGQSLYEVDNRPVPLFLGDRPMSRQLNAGVVVGPDVREIKDNLAALGFAPGDLGADGVFNPATAAAVSRWQASLGVAQTGTVEPADVLFAATALRITTLHATLGASLQAGAPLLDATSTVAVVNVPLDASNEAIVKVGDAVLINLPAGTTAPGTVQSVSRVAVAAANPNQGSGAPPRATIAVTVTLADPASAGGLDQAPVTVGITSQQHNGVLAVPLNSLLALEEGGYAVKLLSGNLVGVKTGLFSDDGMVEVTGALHEGDRVEVPKP